MEGKTEEKTAKVVMMTTTNTKYGLFKAGKMVEVPERIAKRWQEYKIAEIIETAQDAPARMMTSEEYDRLRAELKAELAAELAAQAIDETDEAPKVPETPETQSDFDEPDPADAEPKEPPEPKSKKESSKGGAKDKKSSKK